MSWLKAKPLSISCPPSNNVKRILLDSLNKKTSLPEIESKFPKAFERNLIKRRFRAQVNICSELKKSHPGNFLFIYLDNDVPSSKNLSSEITDVVKKLNQNT